MGWYIVFSQVEVVTLDWADAVSQIVTTTGMGGLAYYLICRHLPAMQDAAREERNEQREYMAERDRRLEDLSQTFAGEKIPTELARIHAAIEELRNDHGK